MLDLKKFQAAAEECASYSGTLFQRTAYDSFIEGARYAVAELRGEIEEYRATLEMYADPLSWRTKTGKIGITPLTDGSDFENIDGQPTGGKMAREALKKYERKSDE